MAQPDTITKPIPAEGMVGTARVLQVIRDEAEAEGWCSEAEASVSKFLGIELLMFTRGDSGYCCRSCNSGLSLLEWTAQKRPGVVAPEGYSYERFSPVKGTPEFIPTTKFVSALKATNRAHSGYRPSLDKIGSEVIGDLWLGFPAIWVAYAERRMVIEVQGRERPTEDQVRAALEDAITELRKDFTADKFYKD